MEETSYIVWTHPCARGDCTNQIIALAYTCCRISQRAKVAADSCDVKDTVTRTRACPNCCVLFISFFNAHQHSAEDGLDPAVRSDWLKCDASVCVSCVHKLYFGEDSTEKMRMAEAS